VILIRALIWSTLFIGLMLVFLPGQVLSTFGVTRPLTLGVAGIAGITIAVAGGALAAWCILTFAVIGKGTPAPFDPPRRLVVRGPYRYVRNPMYIGAGLVLVGAAVLYRSPALIGYLLVLAIIIHAFVLGYEEPTLTRMFGADYERYRSTVHRWVPRVPPASRDGSAA